ncbi:helix-turn-helix domain-containing protein [Bacteriovoracaceae bacterium]|nr:helix-turn-helix domain-containing protein [Bacteriovoracaceae bacterium]
MGKFKNIESKEILEKVEKAKKLKAQGFTQKEIAKRLGLSQSRISELLRGVNWNSKAS